MKTAFSKRMKSIIYGSIPYLICSIFCPKSPKRVYYKYFKDKGYTRYPYPHAEQYMQMPVNIQLDAEKNLRYILHTNGRKLYFPNEMAEEKVVRSYVSLMIEQHSDSPHLYVESMEEFRGKTILDIGSAEGFTAFEAADVAGYIYLFEYDDKWIEALNATFEPWKDKVTIVKTYISDRSDDMNQTLDNFLKDKPKDNLFLKMDIEGAEQSALEGSRALFSEAKDLQFAICTYHKKDDLKKISAFLDSYGCVYSPREGLHYTKHSLRTCLLRGYKKS